MTLITAPCMAFCSVEDTRKMEMVQYRVLKYVYNEFNIHIERTVTNTSKCYFNSDLLYI